jgi:formylglycine-generating enzyme required for sulfatase activity
MGSPSSEKDRNDDETQHKVALTQGFWMGETEVTQEMWESVMGENPSKFKGRKLPVENVSWNDCQQYINKLNKDTPEGYKFALPTEAQWEYAARAGSTTAYCFGDAENKLGDYAWYDANSDRQALEVGTKQPNVWGLYDMHGNVWERCSDWYGDYNGDATDPTGASSGGYRVFRGGGWYCFAECCRSAVRSSCTPDFRHFYLGLRLSLVPQGR